MNRLAPALPRCLWLMACLWAVSPPAGASDSAFFLGFSPANHSWAGAGIAAPRDSGWVHLNPAGLIDLERQADASLSCIFLETALKARGPMANPGAWDIDDTKPHLSGHAGIVFPHETHAWGAAFISMGGAGSHLPHSRSLLGWLYNNQDRRLIFQQGRIGLGYAWDLGQGWSIGAGVHVGISRLRTDHLTLRLRPTEGQYHFDWAGSLGATLSLQKQWERWGFAMAYTTREWTQKFDRYKDLVPHGADMPPYAQTGLRFSITPKVTLLTDLRWIQWSAVKVFSLPPTQGGFGRGDTWSAKLGVEWKAHPKWTFRAGYSRMLDTPVPSEHVFANALAPNLSLDHAALGISHAIDPKTEVQLVWTHVFPEEVKESSYSDIFAVMGHGSRIREKYELFTVGLSRRF